jgi:hypothetical protein
MFDDEFSAISSAPMGRWEESLPAEDVAALELVAAPWMRHLGYTLSGQVMNLAKPTLQHRQYRMQLIGRLLALTLEAKFPQEQMILRTAIANLADPSRIETIVASPIAPRQLRGRVFGMLQNSIKLSILFLKEFFRK